MTSILLSLRKWFQWNAIWIRVARKIDDSQQKPHSRQCTCQSNRYHFSHYVYTWFKIVTVTSATPHPRSFKVSKAFILAIHCIQPLHLKQGNFIKKIFIDEDCTDCWADCCRLLLSLSSFSESAIAFAKAWSSSSRVDENLFFKVGDVLDAESDAWIAKAKASSSVYQKNTVKHWKKTAFAIINLTLCNKNCVFILNKLSQVLTVVVYHLIFEHFVGQHALFLI